MGDPAGIGPETIAAIWDREQIHRSCRAIVLGHPEIMRRAVHLVQSQAAVVEVTSLDHVVPSTTCMPVLKCGHDDVLGITPATIDARAGQCVYDTIVTASRLALERKVDAMVTAPLNKAALSAAGHDFPGHTELLAHLCHVSEVAMMLYLGPGPTIGSPAGLGIAHATLHVALRDVFEQLSTPRVVCTAELVEHVMGRLLRSTGHHESPRLAVCALNPHAGEETLFGDEEVRIIEPAVRQCASEGMQIQGPFSTDTLLARAAAGEFDGIVAMYHDQGHIALKLLDMYRAVNITLGLPIVRTSVAHGTAFDLAWQGRAQSDGLLEAIRVAIQLTRAA